ncbi:MAG: PilZ domain-containing protein [Candidatus Acidiferrales bacterium]|nr:PilZ domain-containing protein [Candidatus Acidoferrales bacterium]
MALYEVKRVAASGKRRADSVDSIVAMMHDSSTMPSTDPDNRRRSSRVFTRIPVKIRGMNSDGNKFREGCQTIVVNAHGGLLYLNESVEMGAQLQMTNPASDEEQECRVVYLGDTSDKGQRVGLEFLSPAPHFWGVEFADPAPQRRQSSPSSRPPR